MPILKKSTIIRNNSGGYTITEMILVIVITGILAGISVPSLINWKHFQNIKTRQLALKTTIEKIKSDAKRWGAICTIEGKSLKSTCKSAVMQKNITDTLDSQSTPEEIINPTVQSRTDEDVYIATNFKTITFSPRGFIHVEPIIRDKKDAIFVLGYQSQSDPFQDQAPELCIIVQNLTGRISIKQRNSTKLQGNNAVFANPTLTC